MMGFDMKWIAPQLERAVVALETIAEAAREMAETAKVQRETITGHAAAVRDQVTSKPQIHLVDGKPKGKK